MDINYPESYCKYSPGKAHYYRILTGDIWRCIYCWTAKWIPPDWTKCLQFSNDIRKIGLQKAYKKWLLARPKTTRLLEKLEEIRLLKTILPEDELLIAIATIVTDKDFQAADTEKSLSFVKTQNKYKKINKKIRLEKKVTILS